MPAEVVAFTMGPAQAREALVQCLAMGTDAEVVPALTGAVAARLGRGRAPWHHAWSSDHIRLGWSCLRHPRHVAIMSVGPRCRYDGRCPVVHNLSQV